MKKFSFRLERLLHFHQQRQKQAELRMLPLAIERDAANAEVHDITQRIRKACNLNEVVGRSIDPGARMNAVRHVEQLGRVMQAAEERLKLAEQRFREAEQERTEITQSVEALLHLRRQRQTEHNDETNRQLQIELDEVVMRQWSTRGTDVPESAGQLT